MTTDLVRLDADTVERWFTVLADRFGRVVERVTVQLYLDAFDRAKLTDRGLDQACREIFETARFLPEPEAFIIRARDAERRFRNDETPKLPRMDRDRQDAGTFNAEYDARAREARQWARDNPELFNALRHRIEVEHCYRADVARPDMLSPVRAEMLKAELVTACLAVKRHGAIHTCELPPDWTERQKAAFVPLSDVTAAALHSLTSP